MKNEKKYFHNSCEPLDVTFTFRAALSKILSRSKESRHILAGRLSELTGRDISKSLLDKICSHDLTWALRAEDLPATVALTGSVEHVQALLDPIGYSIITNADNRLIEIARLRRERDRILEQIARLEDELNGGGR